MHYAVGEKVYNVSHIQVEKIGKKKLKIITSAKENIEEFKTEEKRDRVYKEIRLMGKHKTGMYKKR